MPKLFTPGKICIVTAGRYAGKKCVVVESHESTKDRTYGHVLVAGIDRAPLAVTKRMSNEKVDRRSRVKPFLKVMNATHVMATRYTLDGFRMKELVLPKNPCTDVKASRSSALQQIKNKFQNIYKDGKNKWFFNKLRF
ncbi:hypothetical protein PCE1_002627 [Barthelona sp. PCE]